VPFLRRIKGYPPFAVPDLDRAIEAVCRQNFPASPLGVVIVAAFDDVDRGDMELRVEKITPIGSHESLPSRPIAVRAPPFLGIVFAIAMIVGTVSNKMPFLTWWTMITLMGHTVSTARHFCSGSGG
jgi:hypothetical protein